MANLRYAQDRARSVLRPFLGFLGVILALFVFRRLPITGPLLLKIEAPIQAFGAKVGQGISRIVASDDSLSALLNTCTEDKTLLARDAVEFARLQDENAELQELLGYKEMDNRPTVTAKIVARSLKEETSKVVIDKGNDEGITVGSIVVVGQGVVFGTVTSVDAHTSVVSLLASTESKIPASILGKKKTIGLLEGREGAVLSLQFVPREADVARGDVVATSGLEGQIPEGLLLGTVTEVIDMESAPFVEALVEPLESPLEWNTVLVLKAVAL